MPDRDRIIEQALSLNAEDRVMVADALEKSLTQGDFASPEIAAAWAVEIERRIEAYDRGEAQAAPIEAALVRLQERLSEHRRRRSGP